MFERKVKHTNFTIYAEYVCNSDGIFVLCLEHRVTSSSTECTGKHQWEFEIYTFYKRTIDNRYVHLFTKRAVAFDIWFTSIAFPNALSHKQKLNTTKTWCLFFRCWNALRPPPPHSIHLQLYPSLLLALSRPHIICLFCTSSMSCRLWTSIEQLKTIKEFKRQFSWLGRNFRKSLNAISGNFAGSVRRKFALRITFKFYRRTNASENK